MEDEPASKKPKSEDSLMPEEEFLRRNKVHSCRRAEKCGCLFLRRLSLGWIEVD